MDKLKEKIKQNGKADKLSINDAMENLKIQIKEAEIRLIKMQGALEILEQVK